MLWSSEWSEDAHGYVTEDSKRAECDVLQQEILGQRQTKSARENFTLASDRITVVCDKRFVQSKDLKLTRRNFTV